MYETKDLPSTDEVTGTIPQNILYVTVKMDAPSLLDCDVYLRALSTIVDEVLWKTERGAWRILSRGLCTWCALLQA